MVRAAFARLQADLDPLAAAEQRARQAAAGDEGGPALPRPHPPPPPRRYTEAERARMATADRVVGAVLRGLDEKERDERGEKDAPPPVLPPGPLLEGGPGARDPMVA